MKKTTLILFITIACLLTGAAYYSLWKLNNAKQEPAYGIVRDTVLIDTYKDKGLGKADHYELYYTADSLYMYDAQRLVAVFEAWDTKVDSVLIADNE